MSAGDEVSAGGQAGRILRVIGTKVQVDIDGRAFWYDLSEVSASPPAPKPTFMALRFSGPRRGVTEEVRGLCSHGSLASSCEECGKETSP